jgi:hypothetical protein
MVARRQDLVAALSAHTENSFRSKTRRFLRGLSADELEYIAEFLGCSILESAAPCQCSRAQMAERIAEFRWRRPACRRGDDDHKMILLLEYLCRSGQQSTAMPRAASRAAGAN